MRRGSIAVAFLVVVQAAACNASADVKPTPSAAPSSSSVPSRPSPRPTTTEQPTSTPATRPGESPTATPDRSEFEFVHWLSRDVQLVLAPGSKVVTGTTNDHPIAAVLERRVVDGMEWIKVEVGFGSTYELVSTGWAPHVADVDHGGKTVHVDPVYEPTIPDCPRDEPTIDDLAGMVPLQAVDCFGNAEMTFSPVIVRDDGAEDSELVDGSPEWLAEVGPLAAYWLPEWNERGSIRLQIDPRSGIEIGEGIWVEIIGHLDDPIAGTCSRTSKHGPEFELPDPQDAVPLCRGRFVVTHVRRLTDAEIPHKPPAQTPGPAPSTSAQMDVRELHPPIPPRADAAAVWTGSEALIWGGFRADTEAEQPLADGAAYNPTTGAWRKLPDGPLLARSASESVWTGTEMLVWGGESGHGTSFDDGAAYRPAGDSWRVIGDAPIKWRENHSSAWTGSEWWIAVERGGHVDVAAYDPSADRWRSLPAARENSWAFVELEWTGSEVLMKSPTGIYRMAPDDTEWTFEVVDFTVPLTWAEGLLYGSRFDNYSPDPLGYESFWHPVAWDPTTSSMRPIAAPPDTVFQDPVWTGKYVAYFDFDLAYDPNADAWIRLEVPHDPEFVGVDSVLDNDGALELWAGDRLIVWGGTDECFDVPELNQNAFELIPAWPTGTTETDVIARAASTARFQVRSVGNAGQSVALAC